MTYRQQQRVDAICVECGCYGSLAGIKARVERDMTPPLTQGQRCTDQRCTCHQPVPTDVHLALGVME